MGRFSVPSSVPMPTLDLSTRKIGLALGSGAYLTALRRTASGDFRLSD